VAIFRAHGLLHFENLARQFRWIKFAITLQKIHQHFGLSRRSLLIRHGLRPVFRSVFRSVFRLIFRRSRPTPREQISIPPLLNRQFAERIGLQERIQRLDRLTQLPQTVREYHWQTLTQGVMAYTLEQMDQYAAMFSLEARHPFMDKRLIEFCLALPSEQKLSQGWGRIVMRRGLDGILPNAIQWRRDKADLTPNFMDGLLNRNRQILEEVMTHQLSSLEQYINVDCLQAAYHRLIAGRKVESQDRMVVWQAIILAWWLNHKQLRPPD
jgi:asparagine synthase (glutamine-hydrolysing)